MSNDACFNELMKIIHHQLKLDCHEYNLLYIKRRINARLMANNLEVDNYKEYMKILKSEPNEIRKLYDALTVNVTQFFRDITLWNVLSKDIFQKIAEEKKAKSELFLNIWSCGCSSGEEPYTLSMLLKENVNLKGLSYKIFATDIDDFSLNTAKNGIYNIEAFKSMPDEYKNKYIKQVQIGNNTKYEVNSDLKQNIQFIRHNFMSDPPPLRNFDMIFCRNVIIYFTNDAKDKLMNIFYHSLVEHGWLILGKSEVLFTIKSKYNFYMYNSEERIYRRERRKMMCPITQERRKKWWSGYDNKNSDIK